MTPLLRKASRHSPPWGGTAVLLVLCLGVAALNAKSAPSISEHEVKAAYVVKMARFIQWPAGEHSRTNGEFVIGVYGSDSGMLLALQSHTNETIHGARIVARACTSEADLRVCRIAYVCAGVGDALRTDIVSAGAAGVLTVGETPGFADDGGMIEFYAQDRNIRFRINRRTAEQAGLQVGSKLLDLARVADTAESTGRGASE